MAISHKNEKDSMVRANSASNTVSYSVDDLTGLFLKTQNAIEVALGCMMNAGLNVDRFDSEPFPPASEIGVVFVANSIHRMFSQHSTNLNISIAEQANGMDLSHMPVVLHDVARCLESCNELAAALGSYFYALNLATFGSTDVDELQTFEPSPDNSIMGLVDSLTHRIKALHTQVDVFIKLSETRLKVVSME